MRRCNGMLFTIFFAILACEVTVDAASPATMPTIVQPWLPDQGDGTFRNPVICADYSDPDVIRDGDDFYLVASSFNCTPDCGMLFQ